MDDRGDTVLAFSFLMLKKQTQRRYKTLKFSSKVRVKEIYRRLERKGVCGMLLQELWFTKEEVIMVEANGKEKKRKLRNWSYLEIFRPCFYIFPNFEVIEILKLDVF